MTTSLGALPIHLKSFKYFSRDIKLAHSLFALPFAASAIFVGTLSLPSPVQIFFLFIAMISARSFAMGMNRYLDAEIDAKNPRTINRMIPSKKMTATQTLSWSFVAAVGLIVSAFSLNQTAGILSFPLLLVLALYSKMKSFSFLTHWYLGFCLGCAPIGVEIALVGSVSQPILLLGTAIAFWTAGFDIMYALQDMRFDREYGLKSIPAFFGPSWSLVISKACFGVMIVCLLMIGGRIYAGSAYYLGVGLVASILVFEHFLISDARIDGTSKNINAAFFNANASVSIVFFTFLAIDQWGVW